MSAFLGPVHFWLYDKIGRQEELTKAVALYASENGWIADQNDYIKDLPALEGVIDTGNIHGWLQNQIHDLDFHNIAPLSQSLLYERNLPSSRRQVVRKLYFYSSRKVELTGAGPIRW